MLNLLLIPLAREKPAGEWDEGAEVEMDLWRRPWGAESVGDESHLETVSET